MGKKMTLQRVVAGIATFLAWAAASGAEVVPDSLRRCADLAEPARRLACLDAALQQLGVPIATAADRAATGTTTGAAATVAPATAAPTAAAPAATVAAAAAAGAAAAPVTPTLTPEQKFGATGELKLKQEPKPAEPALEQLTANISEVRQAPGGNYVVRLDNGQVWRQVTPADMMMRVGEPVTIKPRALGSFWLIDASGRGSRFKRIQ